MRYISRPFIMFALIMSTAFALALVPALVKDASAMPPSGSAAPHQDMSGNSAMGQNPLAGKVVETMDSGGYTYVCLEFEGKKQWVAAPKMAVKKGDNLVFTPGAVMPNFKSDSLNRTFESIVFSPGPLALPGTSAERKQATAGAGAASAGDVKVKKATGKNAHTVAELYSGSSKLNGKEVAVRGKVVKVSMAIMNTNWVHIQDGTGDAGKGTNNLVVTTDDAPAVGDVVTASGKLVKDKDFGYGYKYDVIIEKGKIKK